MSVAVMPNKKANLKDPVAKRFSKYDRAEVRARKALLQEMPWTRRWMLVRLDDFFVTTTRKK